MSAVMSGFANLDVGLCRVCVGTSSQARARGLPPLSGTPLHKLHGLGSNEPRAIEPNSVNQLPTFRLHKPDTKLTVLTGFRFKTGLRPGASFVNLAAVALSKEPYTDEFGRLPSRERQMVKRASVNGPLRSKDEMRRVNIWPGLDRAQGYWWLTDEAVWVIHAGGRRKSDAFKEADAVMGSWPGTTAICLIERSYGPGGLRYRSSFLVMPEPERNATRLFKFEDEMAEAGFERVRFRNYLAEGAE